MQQGQTGRRSAMNLDARLMAAYQLVPPCGVCADIGADHGKLSAALLLRGRVRHMLVADISEKALAKAQQLLADWHLTDRATFAVADGLDALAVQGVMPVEAVCIMGMGGDTIAGILRRGAQRLGGAALVLGAHTELPALRQAVCDIGYRLREERIAEASGRFYVLMQATPAMQGEIGYSERELFLGACLLWDKPLGWEKFLRNQKSVLQRVQSAMLAAESGKDRERLLRTEQELAWIRDALKAFCH